MAVGSTEPVTEMTTRNISVGGGQCVGQPYHLHVPIALPSSFNSITDTQSSKAGVTLTHLLWDI